MTNKNLKKKKEKIDRQLHTNILVHDIHEGGGGGEVRRKKLTLGN